MDKVNGVDEAGTTLHTLAVNVLRSINRHRRQLTEILLSADNNTTKVARLYDRLSQLCLQEDVTEGDAKTEHTDLTDTALADSVNIAAVQLDDYNDMLSDIVIILTEEEDTIETKLARVKAMVID